MDTTWHPGLSLDEVERQTIIAALRYHDGNRTHAAGSLKIAVRTLTNKIRKYREDGRAEDIPAAPGGGDE